MKLAPTLGLNIYCSIFDAFCIAVRHGIVLTGGPRRMAAAAAADAGCETRQDEFPRARVRRRGFDGVACSDSHCSTSMFFYRRNLDFLYL